MNVDLTLPEAVTFTVRDPQGNVLFEEEALYLESLLVEAQEGTNPEDPTQRDQWLPNYTKVINAKYGCEISDTHAYALAVKVCDVANELKKSMTT